MKNFQFLSYFSLECLCLYLSYASKLQGWILTPPSFPFENGPALRSSYVKRPLLAQYLKTNPYLAFFSLDLCIMPSTLGKQTCPRNHANKLAEKCVAKYITAKSCKAAGGTWKKFITNYVEKTAGILSTCHDQGDMKLARGVPYEPHKLSQGADQKKQFVLLQKRPDVIYAPSTVVNHNGINMEGKFSSYKWKVPCFPTNTTQRCVLRIR